MITKKDFMDRDHVLAIASKAVIPYTSTFQTAITTAAGRKLSLENTKPLVNPDSLLLFNREVIKAKYSAQQKCLSG